jgi:hypothetical protein
MHHLSSTRLTETRLQRAATARSYSIPLHPNPFVAAKHFRYARRRNHRKGSRRRARREGAVHSGGRICARGNRAHPGRKTWCALSQASHRYWFVKGASRWCETAAAKKGGGFGKGTTPGKTRDSEGAARWKQEAFGHALAGDQTSVETGRALGRFQRSALAANSLCRAQTHFRRSITGCEESRKHAQAESLKAFSS